MKNDHDQVWVVGQICAIAETVEGYPIERPQIWEFTGVFCSQQDAVAACRDRTYFVMGPVRVGEAAPHATTPDWAPSFYPIQPTNNDIVLPGEETLNV